MKVKNITYNTMLPFHTYITLNRMYIYKTGKTYSSKNTTILKYEQQDDDSYNMVEEIKINPKDKQTVMELIDLGTKPWFILNKNKLIFADLYKAQQKHKNFISQITI